VPDVVVVLAVELEPPPQALRASKPVNNRIILNTFITNLPKTIKMDQTGSNYCKEVFQRTGTP
jgi:hypothetical protein